ncbi:MAG: lysophospholipid acyltransferase family protein [Halieaceae bacterium]|jgi:1-acyl-sn-glycerol-3-phosphate acyltransferase|nr:lysophospholipid acyltransferase family protein [Halieaceae bacterium]
MKQSLSRWLLRILGWRIEGTKPDCARCVLIAAPHTSNWDFPLMLLFAWSFGMRISWMGKRSLFAGPLGPIMRRLGGIPIDRSSAGNVVSNMTAAFAEKDELLLAVPTEGTRARVAYWKSGFYFIARQAGVPIVPSYLDFSLRRAGFGEPFSVSGDVHRDMAYLRAFYEPMVGKFPENFGPVRIREEEKVPVTVKRVVGE